MIDNRYESREEGSGAQTQEYLVTGGGGPGECKTGVNIVIDWEIHAGLEMLPQWQTPGEFMLIYKHNTEKQPRLITHTEHPYLSPSWLMAEQLLEIVQNSVSLTFKMSNSSFASYIGLWKIFD